jgi:modulator of FtsH protease HflC
MNHDSTSPRSLRRGRFTDRRWLARLRFAARSFRRSANALLAGIVALLAAVIVVAFSSMYTLDEAEQAIIVQFGAPVGDPVVTPGLHFKLPFVQEVHRFDKRLLSWDGDPNQIPTRGEQFISVDTTARWRIVSPLTFLRSVRDERGAQNRLNDILDSVVRDHIAASELVDIVRSKDWEISVEDLERAMVVGESDEEILLQEVQTGREELVRSVLETAQKQMPQYGIELIDIRIKRVDYVEAVQQRVFERMTAERQRMAEKFRSEGTGKAAEIEGETERMLAEIQSEAQRDAEIIRGQADAKAARIYSEAFGADPEFFAFFRTLESYRDALGKDVTMIIRSDSPYFRFFRQSVDWAEPLQARSDRSDRDEPAVSTERTEAAESLAPSVTDEDQLPSAAGLTSGDEDSDS